MLQTLFVIFFVQQLYQLEEEHSIIHTMITVSDIVSLETPPKNEAAPIRAKAPGSIHSQNLSVGTPP